MYELAARLASFVESSGLPPDEITSLIRRLQQAAVEHAFFKTLIDALPDPAFLKDHEGRYSYINPAFVRWLGGKSTAELLGKTIDTLFDKPQAEEIKAEDQKVLATGTSILEKYESMKRADGIEVWVAVTKIPIADAAGELRYIAGFRREVTDRKKTEDFLHDIVSNARCILWTARVTRADREFKWKVNVLSSRIARLELGLHENSNELWSSLASDEDMHKMNETATHALRRNASGYENEFAIRGLDGSVRNLREVVRITSVRPNEWDLVGVAMDVTEQEQAERELQKSLSIVSATVESTEDGVLVVNREGEIVFFNSRFAEMWGIPEHIILSCDDSLSLDFAMNLLVDPDAFIQRVEEAYSQPDAVFYDILKFKDGRVFERHSHPQRTGSENSGRVWIFRDISKRARMEEQLAAANARLIKLVKEDALTGLLNRRTVLEAAELEWARWQRSRKPFSVLLIDIDDFKKINDRFGHVTGDRALKLIADALKGTLRGLDLVGRYGGEEFIVILPETPIEGASVVAEKMLEGIRQLKLIASAQLVPLTGSIGAAAAKDVDKDIDALIHRADIAMYLAKRAGKNAVSAPVDVVNIDGIDLM